MSLGRSRPGNRGSLFISAMPASGEAEHPTVCAPLRSAAPVIVAVGGTENRPIDHGNDV